MGRPKAEDVLQDLAANEIREAIRDVRTLKGLKNKGIAKVLRWTVRQVTSALVDSSKLRAPNAKAILNALAKMEPQEREAQKRIIAARPWLTVTLASRYRPPKPAALIPTTDVNPLATLLADALAKRPGVGRVRRKGLRGELQRALSSARSALATTFVDRYDAIFTAAPNVAAYRAALSKFGDPDRFDRIFLRRGLGGIAKLHAAAIYLEDVGLDKKSVQRLMDPLFKAVRERNASNDISPSPESED